MNKTFVLARFQRLIDVALANHDLETGSAHSTQLPLGEVIEMFSTSVPCNVCEAIAVTRDGIVTFSGEKVRFDDLDEDDLLCLQDAICEKYGLDVPEA